MTSLEANVFCKLTLHIHRNADSPVGFGDGTLKFVKPLEEDQLFEEFLDYVTSQELSHTPSGDVRYAQTRQHTLFKLEEHIADWHQRMITFVGNMLH